MQTPEWPIETTRGGGHYLSIPRDNLLNVEGLARIKARTRRRHERFAVEADGAQMLVQQLEVALGRSVNYDSQGGSISMEPSGNHEWEMVLFGTAEADLRWIMERTGASPQQAAEGSVKVVMKFTELFRDGGWMTVQTPGEEELRFTSMEDFQRFLDRRAELRDEQVATALDHGPDVAPASRTSEGLVVRLAPVHRILQGIRSLPDHASTDNEA